METGQRRFGISYRVHRRSLIKGIFSCNCVKWCMPMSFWVQKSTSSIFLIPTRWVMVIQKRRARPEQWSCGCPPSLPVGVELTLEVPTPPQIVAKNDVDGGVEG